MSERIHECICELSVILLFEAWTKISPIPKWFPTFSACKSSKIWGENCGPLEMDYFFLKRKEKPLKYIGIIQYQQFVSGNA